MAPILDTLGLGLEAVRVAYAVSADDQVYQNATLSRPMDITLGVTLGALFATSAIYGYAATSSCQDAKERAREPRASEAAPPFVAPRVAPRPPAPAPRIVTAEPPKGAGGFEFGTPLVAAQQACLAAGGEWRVEADDRFSCSAVPEPLGTPTSAVIDACGALVCAVSLVVALPGTDAEMRSVYQRARGQLLLRYGDPVVDRNDLVDRCGLGAVNECLARQGTVVQTTWQFPRGDSVGLRLVLGADGKPLMRVTYDTPSGVTSPEAPSPAPPTEQPACAPGRSLSCAGPGGCSGFQVCAEDGMRFEECRCQ